MPRNGSGTMSVTNSFTSGTTIASASVNANFTDFASEVTNSLPRDGQAAMTGQFKAATGTAAAPGMSFGSDTDTGFYRASANTMGVAVGGSSIGTIDASGFADAAGAYAAHFAAGTVMLFAQTTAPTGWTKGSTHDNKALRVVTGTASSGGSTAFTSVFTARTIAEANLPSHVHTGPAHTHTFSATTSTESATHTHSGSTAGGGSHGHLYDKIASTATGGTGGTVAGYSFSSTATDTVANHVHSFTSGTESATHTHTVSGTTGSDGTGATGATGSGTAVDFAVQYVDVILATKD